MPSAPVRQTSVPRALRWLALVSMPLAAASLFDWANVFFNPMVGAFRDTVEIENGSGRPIRIVPVARAGQTQQTPLPAISAGRFPFRLHRTCWDIAPGASVAITYDGDDHVVTDLLIRDGAEAPRLMTLAGSSRESSGLDRWKVPPLDRLPAASGTILDVPQRARLQLLWQLAVELGWILLLIFGGLYLIVRKRPSRAVAPAARGRTFNM